MFACPATEDFFRSRIDQMIDLGYPLAVLASRMPWQEIEARVAHSSVRKASAMGAAVRDGLSEFLNKAQRIAAQSTQRNAKDGQPKLYAWHAPEVSCLSKARSAEQSSRREGLTWRRMPWTGGRL